MPGTEGTLKTKETEKPVMTLGDIPVRIEKGRIVGGIYYKGGSEKTVELSRDTGAITSGKALKADIHDQFKSGGQTVRLDDYTVFLLLGTNGKFNPVAVKPKYEADIVILSFAERTGKEINKLFESSQEARDWWKNLTDQEWGKPKKEFHRLP